MADLREDPRGSCGFKPSVTVSKVIEKAEDCSRLLTYTLVESGKCEAEQINKYLKKTGYFSGKLKGKILLPSYLKLFYFRNNKKNAPYVLSAKSFIIYLKESSQKLFKRNVKISIDWIK